jgi:Domain of unknown function (DUF4190)
MKSCPTCNQTFDEEWLSFCTQDGTTLIEEAAPAEPPPTVLASSSALASEPKWNPPADNRPPARSPWAAPDPQGWQPPPPPAYMQQQNKSLANAAMVIGIISVTVGWLCLGPLPAIVAIVLGAIALSQIKKSPDRVGGKQAAWVGVITGGLTVLIYAVVMIFYVVVMIAANA